jgi:hypothetical protein
VSSPQGTFGAWLLAQAIAVADATGTVIANTAAGDAAPAEPASRSVHRLTLLLSATLIVVVVVMLGLILLRSLRRWREHVLREPPRPTPTSDVWSMHRLPDDVDADDGPDGTVAEGDEDRPR